MLMVGTRQDVLDYRYANCTVQEARGGSEAERFMGAASDTSIGLIKIGQLHIQGLRDKRKPHSVMISMSASSLASAPSRGITTRIIKRQQIGCMGVI